MASRTTPKEKKSLKAAHVAKLRRDFGAVCETFIFLMEDDDGCPDMVCFDAFNSPCVTEMALCNNHSNNILFYTIKHHFVRAILRCKSHYTRQQIQKTFKNVQRVKGDYNALRILAPEAEFFTTDERMINFREYGFQALTSYRE